MTTSNYLGIHKVLNASSAFMSNFFPNAPPSSMQFAPDGLQGSTAPQETTPSQSLGNTPNIPQYATQGPTLPPLQHKGDGVLSLPHHGFTPQRSQSMASQADNVPSTATPNTASDYDHVTDDFHPYNPTERSEARNSKGSPKRVTSGDSPEGKSVNGRRRTRTKVVAWDPKDLEAIYKRKEVEKEDWDTICRDYPTRTRVAMRQQVIKLRDKKMREAMGLGHRTGKSSTYSDSPQPASSSNGIRWATVNGSSPANIDPYQRRNSLEDEDSSEEYELSSAPDTDQDVRLPKHFDHPVRSTPQHMQPHPAAELPPQPPGLPSMPVIIQEAPQVHAHVPSNFDVVAAQSRGKPIAPRQPPPPPPPLPGEIFDDRQPPPPPPPPAPEFRTIQRTKRGREMEATGSESRSSSSFSKRRKHQSEQGGGQIAMAHPVEGYVTPFRPPGPYPMPSQPSRLPSEPELDELCIRFRDTFRMMRAAYEEDQRAREEQQRIRTEIFEASLGRANARVVQAEQKADEASQTFADQAKDDRLAMRLDIDQLSKEVESQRAETRRWRADHAKVREELAASIDALERERSAKVPEPLHQPDTHIATRPESSGAEDVQQHLRQDAERANAANDLLAEEVTKMQADRAETRHRLQEIFSVHNDLTLTLDNLVSQDLTDLTQKMIKKHVLDVKEVDRRLADKLKEVEKFVQKDDLPGISNVYQSVTATSDGPVPIGKS